MEFRQFLEWERATRDTLDVKLIYIDMADDLAAGVMLSEIIYWYLPSKDGKPNKLTVVHEGHEWIAVPRWEWWERVRLTPRQADEALLKLVNAGLVVKDRFKFNGDVTVHIRLNDGRFMEMFSELAAHPLSNPHKPIRGENGYVEIRKTDMSKSVKPNSRKSTNPITETTAKNTTETTPPLSPLKDEGQGINDPALSEIITAYESNITAIIPLTTLDAIKDRLYRSDLANPKQALLDAIGIAADRNKRSWSYINGILNNMETEGVKDERGKIVPFLSPSTIHQKTIPAPVSLDDERIPLPTPSPRAVMYANQDES